MTIREMIEHEADALWAQEGGAPQSDIVDAITRVARAAAEQVITSIIVDTSESTHSRDGLTLRDPRQPLAPGVYGGFVLNDRGDRHKLDVAQFVDMAIAAVMGDDAKGEP